MGSYTNFLFARPSFLEGVGRLVDFGDTLTEFNRSLDDEQADRLALIADWNAVGEDLGAVISHYVAERNRVEKL
ncbi:MAG: hypothetical protein IT425_06560 [Pirellulales bacterium]|nr:hypothetical protein [Pirellulales bacterium]